MNNEYTTNNTIFGLQTKLLIFMNQLFRIQFLFLMLSFCFSTTSFSQSNPKNQKATIQTKLYCDHCTACNSCGKKFNEELYKIKGVRQFSIDEEAETITVFYNSKKTDLESIKEKIANLGFDADNLKANPEAVANLGKCCQPK